MSRVSAYTEREKKFSNFLKSRSNGIMAEGMGDWIHMPSSKMEEIQSTFETCSSLKLVVNRSFPHEWTISGEVGGRQRSISWTAPRPDWDS